MNVANLWSTVADNRGLLDAIEKGATAGIGIVAMETQAGGAARPDSRLGRQLTPASQTALLKWVLRHEAITTSTTPKKLFPLCNAHSIWEKSAGW